MEIIKNRDNNFNFLRLLFATLVILAHSPELIDGTREREILSRVFHTISFGELAVDEFFILSGFMIIKSWNSQPILIDFLKKRILRIYPAYLVAATLSALLFGVLGANNSRVYLSTFNYSKFFSSLLVLAVPDTPVTFAGTPSPQVNGSMWSLSYEFYCYLIIALAGVLGLNNRKWVWLACFASASIASISLVLIKEMDVAHKNFIIGFSSIPVRLFLFFSAGACFHLFRDKIKLKASIALILLPLLFYFLFIPEITNLSLAMLGGYITFCFAFYRVPFLRIFKTIPDISYGVYLYAWPIQKTILWYFPTMSPWLLFSVAFGISSSLGYLSWILIEAPALKIIPKIKFGKSKVATSNS